jgi:hypothetical protein
MHPTEQSNQIDQPDFTPQELGKLKKLHPDTIIRLYRDEPDVIRLGHGPGRQRDKETGEIKPLKQYYTLRIPRRVAERVFKRLAVKR